jgi:hypothetical protein
MDVGFLVFNRGAPRNMPRNDLEYRKGGPREREARFNEK